MTEYTAEIRLEVRLEADSPKDARKRLDLAVRDARRVIDLSDRGLGITVTGAALQMSEAAEPKETE